jgi:hypothetical protein
MIGNLGNFITCFDYSGLDFIIIADASRHSIKKIGMLYVVDRRWRFLKLNNVLFILGLKKNLLLIGQLTSYNPYHILFTDKSFIMYHRQSRKVIEKGDKMSNNYFFKNKCLENFSNNDGLLCAFVRIVKNSFKFSPDLWHSRLGHPSYDTILKLGKNSIIPLNNFNHTDVCDIYALAKSHALPFRVNEKFACAAFDKVHLDIWALLLLFLMINLGIMQFL